MKFYVLFLLTLTPAVLLAEISAEKQEAIDTYMTLSHLEDSFKVGMKAGMDAGFEPANNPALAMLPAEKLKRIREEVAKLMDEKFKFEDLKPEYVRVIDERFTLEELNKINVFLQDPVIQKMYRENINMIPEFTKLSTGMVQKLQPDIMQVVQKVMSE